MSTVTVLILCVASLISAVICVLALRITQTAKKRIFNYALFFFFLQLLSRPSFVNSILKVRLFFLSSSALI